MMSDFGICEEKVKDPQIVLEEKRSKIIFENTSRKEVRVIRIDACVIEEGPRCDYLAISETGREHFVELKGSDVAHAIKQLEQTILRVSTNPQKGGKYSFIISTRCPLLTAKIQKFKLMFKKTYNSMLIIKNGQYTHKL